MASKAVIEMQKGILSKRIVEDLHQFFRDNYIDVKKIVMHGQNSSIKFYEIHFNNDSKVDVDLIAKSLDKFGYTPKSFSGNLPESFYLLVLVRKQL